MENYVAIDLHQTRDFSRKMNATFEFVKQNFKPLSKSILLIAGPPVLIASMLLGSFFGELFNFSRLENDPDYFRNYFMSVSFWLQMLLAFVFMIISTVTSIATINNYIVLYGEKRTSKIAVSEVWERVRATFWMYLGTTILFTLMGAAVYAILILPIVLLVDISPLLIVPVVILIFCAFVYLLVSASLVYIVRAYERVGFFDAIARSFKLVQGKWWSTFGLVFVLYIIAATISYVFSIPAYTVMFLSSLHSLETGKPPEGGALQIMTTVFFTLYYFLQILLYSLPNVGLAFQYFNLVEMKEARGLMDQIGSIGQLPPPSSAQDEHY